MRFKICHGSGRPFAHADEIRVAIVALDHGQPSEPDADGDTIPAYIFDTHSGMTL